MPTPKEFANDGYRTFLRSQHDAIAALSDISDGDFAWAFGVAIRAGIQQQSIADRITVTQPTISRWSRGDNMPKNTRVRETYISELLGCFADAIVEAGGKRPVLDPKSSRPAQTASRRWRPRATVTP